MILSRIAPRARGFTLIEVLIALVVLAFGMLALARAGPLGAGGARGAAAHAGDDHRLGNGGRIGNNPKQAARYIGDYVPAGPVEDCAALDPAGVVEIDQCEWRNRLRGADTFDGQRDRLADRRTRPCADQQRPESLCRRDRLAGRPPDRAGRQPLRRSAVRRRRREDAPRLFDHVPDCNARRLTACALNAGLRFAERRWSSCVIAMTVALLVLGTVGLVFGGTSRNRASLERAARLADNAITRWRSCEATLRKRGITTR